MADRIITIIGFIFVIFIGLPVLIVLRVSWFIYGMIGLFCDIFINKEERIKFISFEDYLWIFE